MKHEYQYELYNGAQVLQNKKLLFKMDAIWEKYDCFQGNILQYLDESEIVCCMIKNGDLIGFSWMTICKEEQIAELSWFVMDKDKSKGLEGKLLLDKTIEYCKSENISSLKFNCAETSWGRIKNRHKLLSKYGYAVDENQKDYDISINI